MTSRSPTPAGNLALVASAIILFALIMVQAGRAAGGGVPTTDRARDAAFAASMSMSDVVSRVGDFTLMSFDGGNDDVVLVLDGHAEELFAYSIENQKTVKLLARYKLADIFRQAAALGAGQGN